jgi:hypothetical protein
MRYHLAQVNIGRVRAPMEDPIMDGFRNALDRINAIADATPGFVWRLQTPEGNATSIHAWDDPRILVNMSVWTSLEALHRYVYDSDHTPFVRARREWFEPFEGPMLALWWIPEGHIPTIAEAKLKLDRLAAEGPTPEAFTFRRSFPAPGATPSPGPKVDAEFCWGPA